MRSNPLVSICIPTYNSAKIIRPLLESLKKQSYQNVEIVISDDASSDETISIIRSFRFSKLRVQKNKHNLGYGRNLQQLEKLAKGEIIYLMAHDDILINDGITKTVHAFCRDPQVGVVTRAYYWFDTDPTKPVRHIPPIDPRKGRNIDIKKTPLKIIPIIESVGQLSGLAYRRDLFTHFHHEVFPAHIYPFMEILKRSSCVFLKDYTVAIGISVSQTRSKPKIYSVSPTLSWMKMFDTVFRETEFNSVRRIAKDHMLQNYLGLIQLKNYGQTPFILYREILVMLKLRWRNILSPAFWFFSLGTILTPRSLLRYLVDNYKAKLARPNIPEKQLKFN